MRWLNRSLVVSSYCFALCCTERSFYRELRELGVPRKEWPHFVSARGNATTHFFEGSDTVSKCAIVCLGDTGKAKPMQVYALLVHEAVHIWQATREDIGESSPSHEFEAYSIQSIAQELMEAWHRVR